MFEWDESKNQANLEKHRISFEAAKEIFNGPVLTRRDNRQDYGEGRFTSLGAIDGEIVIFVAHTDRENRTRIISARKASRKEREVYYDHFKETLGRD